MQVRLHCKEHHGVEADEGSTEICIDLYKFVDDRTKHFISNAPLQAGSFDEHFNEGFPGHNINYEAEVEDRRVPDAIRANLLFTARYFRRDTGQSLWLMVDRADNDPDHSQGFLIPMALPPITPRKDSDLRRLAVWLWSRSGPLRHGFSYRLGSVPPEHLRNMDIEEFLDLEDWREIQYYWYEVWFTNVYNLFDDEMEGTAEIASEVDFLSAYLVVLETLDWI